MNISEKVASNVKVPIEVESIAKTINPPMYCTGTKDEKLSCYKDKRNNNIEQIKSAVFKKIVCLLFSISK